MKRRRNLLLLVAVTLVIAFLLFSCITDFSQALGRNLKEQAFGLLDVTTQNYSSTVYAKLDGQFYVLRTLSHLLSAQGTDEKRAVQIMNAAVDEGEFGIAVAVGSDGLGSYSNGAKADLSDRDYFERALGGAESIELVEQGAMTGASRFILAVPIERDGQIIGVLAASYNTDVFSNLLLRDTSNQRSHTFICDLNGILLADGSPSGATPGSDLKSLFPISQFDEGLTADDIRQTIEKGESIRFSFLYDGQRYYASFLPLSINGWCMLSTISEQAVKEQYSFIPQQITFLTAKLVLAFLLLLSYILVTERQKKRVLRDEKELLQLEEERYRVVGELSDVALFEGNLLRGSISFSSNFKQLFGWMPSSDRMVDYGVRSVFVHPEDREKLGEIEQSILPHVRQSVNYRITDQKGGWIWCRTEFVLLPDKYDHPCRLFGKISNIDEEIQEIDSLREKAALDSLTKLLNNESTRTEIEAVLKAEPEGSHSLLVVDIDNFKLINDTYGHDQGDAALKAVADGMQRLFRSSDIIGRIGGDEFVMLLRNIPDGPVLERKLTDLCKLFRSLRPLDSAHSLTCSVGCAVYPGCGQDYQTLYRLADKALYEAKRRGKNQYVIFHKA